MYIHRVLGGPLDGGQLADDARPPVNGTVHWHAMDRFFHRYVFVAVFAAWLYTGAEPAPMELDDLNAVIRRERKRHGVDE